MKIDMDLLQN